MNCPKCEGKVTVKDTVHTEHNEIYRRRQCLACKYVFFTSEQIVSPDDEYRKEYYKNYRK